MNNLKHRYTMTPKKMAIIFIFALLMFYLIFTVSAQNSTVVRAEASASQPHVGDTLTVQIIISNVQNLYGVDVTLNWNPSVLQLVSNTSQLGVESNPSGVLHAPSGDPIYYAEADASQATGEYDLVATSVAPATGFSGSGTIATVKFTVISTGSAGLALQTSLSDYNPAGASLIAHTDTADSVTAVAAGSSSTPSSTPTPSATATSSITPGTSTTPTPTPEFPTATALAVVVILASAAIVLSIKKITKPTPASGIKPQI